MQGIKVINNFLTQEECNFYIGYINSNIDKFLQTPETKRFALLFGKDLAHKEKSNLDLSSINDIEPLVKSIFSRTEKLIQEIYKNENKLYVCSFFIAKQIPGSVVKLHYDSDGGINTHFKYGGVIYLNTMENSGALEFPYIQYSYLPKAGDFVIFPSTDIIYSHQVKQITEDRYSLPIWVTEDIGWKIN
jgi:hypothetical protein